MTEEKKPEPIVLVALGDPESKPLLYACGSCGSIHSPTIYLAKKEVQHATALEAAVNCYNCRTHNVCQYCGEQCDKGWTACDPCRLAKKLEAAVEVPDNGGPYFGFDDDQIYFGIDEARDAGHEWVHPCTETYPHIDPDDILENLTSDMFEDASVDDLDGVNEFYAAVEKFNDAQKAVTYWADEKRKIKVPAYAEQPA